MNGLLQAIALVTSTGLIIFIGINARTATGGVLGCLLVSVIAAGIISSLAHY